MTRIGRQFEGLKGAALFKLLAASLVLVVATCASGADDSERLVWSWTKAEKSGLDFLAGQVKADGNGYWVHKGNNFVVRSNVSKELTAEAGRYVERMIAMIPRVLGFQVIAGKQSLRVTVHRSEKDLSSAVGDADGKRVFHRVESDTGGGTADVHLCVDEAEGGNSESVLMDMVDLRLLQREAVRSLLALSAGRRVLSPFVSEGCALFFESWDLHEQVPRKISRMAGCTRQRRLRALQGSVIEENALCPDLPAAFMQSESVFFGADGELNAALAESFVDFMLSSQQRSGRLHSLLYGDPGGGKGGGLSWLAPMKVLLSLESQWHDHICRILSGAVYVQQIDVPVCAAPARNPSVTHLDRYGNTPLISLCPVEKDCYDIGWYEPASGAIHVLKCGADNSKVLEITPEFAGETSALHGFCSVPGKDLYVAGHTKDNEHGNRKCEFWVAGFNGKGDKIFDTRIFGEQNSELVNSKGYPGAAGSSRLVYNPKAKKIGVYTSHTMKWPDNVRHQAGYISLLSLSGENQTVSGWYVSHNFDQRMVVKDGDFYLLAHGDAYPRALVYSKRGSSGGQVFSVNYHSIPGESGDNNTWCQTGGVVVMDDKSSAVVFASSNERESHDVCIKIFDAAGKETAEKWLTTYGAGVKGSYPRIASFGKGLLVAWERSDGDGPVMQCVVLDSSLDVLQKQTSVKDAHLSPFNDMINLSGGSVVWAAAGIGNAIRVYRVDQADKMYEMLSGRVSKEEKRIAGIRVVPKKGVAEQVDAAFVKKLSALSSEGGLPGAGMRLSKSKALIKLVGADAAGVLMFEAGSGSAKKTAEFKYADLTSGDKAAIVSAVVAQEPDNSALCGVAAFYMQVAGQQDMARIYFARAGHSEAAKFRSFFTGRE